MVKIIGNLISKIKKEEYILDSEFTTHDLIYIVLNKLCDYLRGKYKSIGIKGTKRNIFIGKNVKLLHKSHIKFGNGVQIKDYVEINGLCRNGINLGNNASIGKYSIIRGSGSLQKLGKGLTVGENFGCGDFCFFGCTGGIQIGNNVILGQNVRMHSSNHNFDDTSIPIKKQGINKKGIIIEDDCWIGSGVTILDGVKISSGCVIAAGTVVTKSIEQYSVVVGNPGRVIKKRK